MGRGLGRGIGGEWRWVLGMVCKECASLSTYAGLDVDAKGDRVEDDRVEDDRRGTDVEGQWKGVNESLRID